MITTIAGSEWSVSRSCSFNPTGRAVGIYWTERWMGSRSGQDDVGKRKFLTIFLGFVQWQQLYFSNIFYYYYYIPLHVSATTGLYIYIYIYSTWRRPVVAETCTGYVIVIIKSIRKVQLRLNGTQKDCNNRRNKKQPSKMKILKITVTWTLTT
jgi:hypothetical protein